MVWPVTVKFAFLTVSSVALQIVTHDGPVNGRVETIDGRKYGVFKGIPYAQPPVGKLRLRDPVTMLPWAETLDATGDYKSICPQYPYDGNKQSENCLFLNIFTPVTSGADARIFPVMFWIHGGYLVSGSANSSAPTDGILRNLVSRDVLVVTINYRLGPLGFFNTRSNVVSGNYGFMDQTMALEWVQRNIKSFGGDKSKVTIFGQSAGAISVSTLTLSPWSQGLFNQAILMSGSLMYQNLMDDDSSVYVSQQLGKKLNCWGPTLFPDRNQTAADFSTLACMQDASVASLVNTPITVPANTRPWMARVDGRFLPDTPQNLATRRPKINVMIGTAKDEYGILSLTGSGWAGGSGPEVNTKPSEIAKTTIPAWVTQTKFGPKFSTARTLTQYHYISQKSAEAAQLDSSSRPEFWFNSDVQLKSSLAYFLPTYLDASAYLTSQKSSVYLYSFDHETSIFLDGEYFWKGAYHGSDLYFLFGKPPKNSTSIAFNIGTDEQIQNLTETLGSGWTNFAKFGRPTQGNPSGDWRPADQFLLGYFSIRSNVTVMKPSYIADARAFWINSVPQFTGVKPS